MDNKELENFIDQLFDSNIDIDLFKNNLKSLNEQEISIKSITIGILKNRLHQAIKDREKYSNPISRNFFKSEEGYLEIVNIFNEMYQLNEEIIDLYQELIKELEMED